MSRQKYKLDLTVESYEQDLIIKDGTIIIPDFNDNNQNLNLRIQEIEELKGGFGWVIKDFKKLLNALSLPFQNKASRSKMLTLVIVYILLSIPKISTFFIRGWRLGIVGRMINPKENLPIVPAVNTLNDLGEFIRQGVRMIAARATYKLPELIILTAIGYDHFELIIDWFYFFLGRVFKETSIHQTGFEEFATSSFSSLSTTLMIQLFFFIILSLLITPAFRIMMIKYANGSMPYSRFFNLKELKDSFRLYKKYTSKTLGAYFWDILISCISLLIGLITFLIFPFAYFILMPFYKLAFKHWPKSYGYGLLARRLKANGEI